MKKGIIADGSKQNIQLEQVQVIFRHGARTPSFSDPQDQFSNLGEAIWDKGIFMKVLPWTDIAYEVKVHNRDTLPGKNYLHTGELRGGCLTGQLTTIGQQQTYDFGKYLANEYIENRSFIAPRYGSDEIYVRSTNMPRTIQSAVCVVAGLFGKEKTTEPILIHTKDIRREDQIPNVLACAKLVKRLHLHRNNPPAIMKKEQDEINIKMGIKEGVKPLNFIEIHDIMCCRLAHQFFLPTELLEQEELITKNAMHSMLQILGINRIEGTKNAVGSFLETLCCRINETIEGRCKYKMLMYSAHDTTIISLLTVLGVYDGKHCPDFAANIVFEIYKSEGGQRLVRVLYNGRPVLLPAGSNNEEYLPVERFMKLVEVYRVLDWEEDCGNKCE